MDHGKSISVDLINYYEHWFDFIQHEMKAPPAGGVIQGHKHCKLCAEQGEGHAKAQWDRWLFFYASKRLLGEA